jgi:hypothetical protein
MKMLKGEEAASAAAPVAAETAPVAASDEGEADSGSVAAVEPDEGDAADALASFGRFQSKDPFIQQVKPKKAPAGEGDAGAPVDAAAAAEEAVGPILEGLESGQDEESAAAAESGSASIAVNGVVESVTVGGQFPADAPMFLLDSISKGSVTIRVAQGGGFASGDPELTLVAGKQLTLVNTADGTRFVLLLKKAVP